MTARKPLTITASGQRRQLQAGETLQTVACTTANASMNCPHGTAPSSPVNGDLWSTTAGFYGRVNGSTVGPFADKTYVDAGDASTLSSANAYTDTVANGRSWKNAVRAATTTNGTLSSAFENGDTIDGVTLATGDRILIKNQSTATENGIYTVNASGAPTRATDADSGAELVDASCYVSEGSTLADTQWTCTTNAPITLGATNLTFVQSGSGATYTADGVTLDLTATTFSIKSGGVGTTQLANDAVTYAKFQNITDNRLLGRSAGSSGDMQEIQLGAALSLSSGVLDASGLVPSTTLTPSYTTTTPGAPGAGALLFARERAGYTRPAYIGISGVDRQLQDFLGTAEVSMLIAVPNAAAASTIGCVASASFTAKTQTTTSQFTAYRRGNISNVSGTNTRSSGMFFNTATFFRGTSSVIGGAFMSVRFGIETTLANSRALVGFMAAWVGTSDPSTSATDCFAFAKDSADSNWQIMHNDASGNCTKVDMGANFPANTSAADMYQAELWIPPNGSTLYYWIKNLITGNETSGSVNSNLPTTTTAMFAGAAFGSGSTSGVHTGALCQIYTATGMP